MLKEFFKGRSGRSRIENNSITTSAELARVLLGGLPESGVYTVTPAQAMGIAAVQAAVRRISETVGMLPFPVYQEEGSQKTKARDHALWPVLNGMANGWMTAQQFRETMTALALLEGNAYALKVFVRGSLRELLPIHPKRVQVIQSDDWKITYRVSMSDGTTRDFAPSVIFHLSDMSMDSISGMSRVRECREVLGLAKVMQDYTGQFYSNSSIPTGALSTEQNVGPEVVKLVRESWAAANTGTRRRGTAVLDSGFKWQSIAQTAADAQQIETRKFMITEVARIFNIPPHKIGDMERATFSNIDAQNIDFDVSTMMVWYRRWESAVNTQLLGMDDRARYYAKIDNRAMLRGDDKTRAGYYQAMKQNKIMTTNEIRELEDLNPIEGGDILENPATSTSDSGAGDVVIKEKDE